MQIVLSPLFGVNETTDGNTVRQLTVPGWSGKVSIAGFDRGKVRGHLFSPEGADHQILLITNAAKAPADFEYVVRLPDLKIPARAKQIDLTRAIWERHPQQSLAAMSALADYKKLVEQIRKSWNGAFFYKREDPENNTPGLRPPQLGALFAAQSHFSVHQQKATIVMPTGTGKTDAMIAIMVAEQTRHLLVVVPTDPLRTQIADKFITLGLLKQFGVASPDARYPIVGVLRHSPKTLKQLDDFLSKCNVVVTTMSLVGRWESNFQERLARHFSYLFVDEAHHAGAPKWEEFLTSLATTRTIQFTATPYRNDGKPVGGQPIFNYPLGQAQKDGYFKPIDFRAVIEFDPKKQDRAVAEAAVTQLRADYKKGHILMARVNSVRRAEEVIAIYNEYPEFEPVQIHTGITSSREREQIREKILSRKSRIVVCVDMLGEGFDLPELKIAAFHDIRHSLPITLQLAGRFTRSRPDLGNATIVANIAEVSVKEELRSLYQRDVDWNQLLPLYSDKAIADEFDLWEFLGGFKNFPKDISLQNVRPAMSAVSYRTKCREWNPENFSAGIPGFRDLDRVYHDVNSKEDTLVVLTTKRVALDWARIDDIYSWDWQLYILLWDRAKQLLFIHNSSNSGFFKDLAQAVCGNDVECVAGPNVFRCLATVHRLRLTNVGLLEQLGRLIRYTMRAGSDVESGMTEAQKQRAIKANLFGTGFENGHRTSIGCSYKGRIWSHQTTNLHELKRWCQAVGTNLIDESLDPEKVLEGTLRPELVAVRPGVMPLGVDWPDDFYRDTRTITSFSFAGETSFLHEIEIAVEAPSETGELQIAVSNPAHKVVLGLELFESNGAKDFRFITRQGEAVVTRGSTRQSIAEFFSDDPPTIWFANGSSLRGNEMVQLRKTPDPFPRDRIEVWNWSGIDLKKESQGIERASDSIQFRVIEQLRKRKFAVLFDDDDTGEAADVVGIYEKKASIDVELYHCKYSGSPTPGARIDDLYVVCGQAQKCVRWMENPTELFNHLLKREPRTKLRKTGSRFEIGGEEDLWRIREKSRRSRVNLRVFVVQPGVSKKAVSRSQLELLGVTENYLKETFLVSFGMIASN